MTEPSFLPFVPRPRRQEKTRDVPLDPAAPQVFEQTRDELQPEKPPAAPKIDLSEPQQPEEEQPPADEPDALFSSELRSALAQAARRAEIRAEAVRLACLATGRILRHAVAFDPKVVARFVDDALAAAQDEQAIVHLNSAHRSALSARGPQYVADERAAAGAVAVELAAGDVAATLEQRAELVVRAIGAD